MNVLIEPNGLGTLKIKHPWCHPENKCNDVKKYCIGIKKSSLACIIYLTSGHANASMVT